MERGGEKVWVLDTKRKEIKERKLEEITVSKDFYETNFSYLSQEEGALLQYKKEIEEYLITPLEGQIALFPKDYQTFLKRRFSFFLKKLENWRDDPHKHKECLDNAIETELFANGVEEHAARVFRKIQNSSSNFQNLAKEENCSLCLFMASQFLRTSSYKDSMEDYLKERGVVSFENLSLLLAPKILSLSHYFLNFFIKKQFEVIIRSMPWTTSTPVERIINDKDWEFLEKKREEYISNVLFRKTQLEARNLTESLRCSEKEYGYSIFFCVLAPLYTIVFPS